MMGKSHKRMGIIVGCVIAVVGAITGSWFWLSSITTVPAGAMFPDIDHNQSKLGRIRRRVFTAIKIALLVGLCLFLVMCCVGARWNVLIPFCIISGIVLFVFSGIARTKRFKKAWKFISEHRGIMHSLVPPAIMVILGKVCGIPMISYALYGFAIGDFVHLLGDVVTLEDVPLLWPIIRRSFNVPIIRAGDKAEKSIATVMGLIIGGVLFVIGLNFM